MLRGNNRLVVAASSSGQHVLVQLTAAGAPDPQFGTNGRVRTPSLPAPSDLALLSQGRIVTAGAQAGSGPVTVARFRANGTLDPTFSGDGIATTAVYGSPAVTGVGVQPDGKVVVSLDHQTLDAAVTRFTSTGALDTAFGLDGVASELEIESEETLVANVADGAGGTFSAGWRWEPQARAFNLPSNSLVVQHSATGRIVRSFGSGGFAEHRSLQRVAGIARQSDGRLVLAGFSEEYDGADRFFTIARLNADGTPDQGFVTTGAAANAFRLGVPSAATGVAVRGDGRIVAVGTRGSDGASVDRPAAGLRRAGPQLQRRRHRGVPCPAADQRGQAVAGRLDPGLGLPLRRSGGPQAHRDRDPGRLVRPRWVRHPQCGRHRSGQGAADRRRGQAGAGRGQRRPGPVPERSWPG